MTITTAVHPQPWQELRTKLSNLVEDVEDRLADETTRNPFLMERLMDRLWELAHDCTISSPDREAEMCQRCGRLPATAVVYAGAPGTGQFRSRLVCVHCTLPSITWVSTAGAVHVRPYHSAGTEAP